MRYTRLRAVLRAAVEPWWANGTPALVLASLFIVGSAALLALAIIERSDGWGLGLGALGCAAVGVAAGRLWWRRISDLVAALQTSEERRP